MRIARLISSLIILLALALVQAPIMADEAPVPVAEPTTGLQQSASPGGRAVSPAMDPPSAPLAAGTSATGNPGSVGGAPIPSKQPEQFSLLSPQTWPFSLVPVPEIATDPNQGVTVGLLPVFLFNDEHHEIRDIIAPDINVNTITGAGGTFRYLSYPSEDTQWYAIAGASQNIARKVDLFYSTGRTHSEWWSFDGRVFFERDPTERFFGIGNETEHGGQTNYTTEQVYGLASMAVNFTQQLQLALVEKPRYIRILSGALENLPSIGKLYPDVKGINGGSDVMNRLIGSYDTRDSPDIPRAGVLLRLFGNLSDRRFMSSVSYTQFGGDAHGYWTFAQRFTLASHFFLQYTPAGNETPFWAMARLGGEDSLLTDQQTLRGYGTGRFVDNNLIVGNVEMRTRVYEMEIFDTHGVVELAPFLEAGRVFHTAGEDPFVRMHPVGGIGVRGIAEPFVVGYVDIGVGGEGGTIFSGINYPF